MNSATVLPNQDGNHAPSRPSHLGRFDALLVALALASLLLIALGWMGIYLNPDHFAPLVIVISGLGWGPLWLRGIWRRGGRAELANMVVAMMVMAGLFGCNFWVALNFPTKHIRTLTHPGTRAVFFIRRSKGFETCEQVEIARLGGWLVESTGLRACTAYEVSPAILPGSLRLDWFDGPGLVALAATPGGESSLGEVFIDVFRYTADGRVSRVPLVPGVEVCSGSSNPANCRTRDAKIRILVRAGPHGSLIETPATTLDQTAPAPTLDGSSR